MKFKNLFLLLNLIFLSLFSFANTFHEYVSESEIPINGEKYIQSSNYKTINLNLEALTNFLEHTPQEFTGTFLTIALPNYKGEVVHFKLTESKIMQDGLAAKFPNFKTYNGQGVEDPTANLKLDITHKGLHAYVRDLSGTWAIDPYHNNTTQYYLAHHKNGFITNKYQKYTCGVEAHSLEAKQEELSATFNNVLAKQMQLPECVLRTYRVAINATGEFTSFHGGTVPDALAAIVTTLNRINGVYERDNALRMILVDNNDLVIYTNANTDPFTNGDAGTMIDESHDNLINVIGTDNFDIGHVFSNSGAGLANLSAACGNQSKGRGVTGVNPPVGDFFDIDYASHEFGHQYSANHTWDYCSGGGNGGTATMEPGSASTIMGYADLCGANNLQNFSDDYFHSYNILEITNFTQLGNGNNCPLIITSDNNAPSVDAGDDYIIPMGTPFELTGNGSDPDGDVLTYCWEQFNTGDGVPVSSPVTNNAIFRTWLPTTDNFRIFPRLQELLNNTTIFGETLPEYNGIMNFRLTVRDNFAGSGCTNFDDMVVDVDASAGPFVVNFPNGGEALNAYSIIPVNWDVANTDLAPVSCSEVDILLSLDGGLTYPIVLADNVSNNGSYNLTVPDEPTTTARVKVVCSDNIFFDISNNEFSIIEPTLPTFVFGELNGIEEGICAGDDVDLNLSLLQILGFMGNVNFGTSNLTNGVNISFSNSSAAIPSNVIATLSNTSSFNIGNNQFEIIGISGSESDTVLVNVFVEATGPMITQLLTPANNATDVQSGTILEWTANSTATLGYEIQISLDEYFNSIIESNFTSDIFYTPVLANINSTQFYWRVRALNYCGEGSWGSVFNFTTSNCNDFLASQLPNISFGDNSSTITISDPGLITSVEIVNLEIEHTRIGNCEISLTSPSGSSIILFDNDCGNDNDMLLNFKDAGANNMTIPCPPTNGGSYQAAIGSFADFAGENALGDWILNINDNQQPQGNGTLLGWELKICANSIGPNVIVLAEDTEICQGESTSMSAFGADSYLWYPAESLSSSSLATVTASPTQTTTYWLIGTDATGTNQKEITVTVNELPELEILNLPDSVLNANTISLMANPPGGDFSGPGVNGNILDPYYSQSGWVDISYTYTDANGCTNTVIEQTYIGIATDIENFTNTDAFNLYQSETDVWLNVKKADELKLQVFDLKGAEVLNYQQNFDTGLYPLKNKILNLGKGVYVIKVENNTTFMTLKFYQI